MQESIQAKSENGFGLPQQDPSLTAAYDLCEAITHHCSKSFYLATQLLPPTKRRAIRTLYAFCRQSDNLVDEPSTHPAAAFERWVIQSRKTTPTGAEPVLQAWQDLHQRYHLADEVIADLLAGLRMDLSINRYATFADLWLYCYRVAGTVGLLSMQIIGHEPDAEPYAIKLGVALQLTNILRDVGEDAQRGRIYLPQDELTAYGLTNEEIFANSPSAAVSGNAPPQASELYRDQRWQRLMRFQIQRARQLYQEAWPGIPLLNRDGRYAVAAAATLYRAILVKLEENQYDNFNCRAAVPTYQKLWMLPGIWRDMRRISRENDRVAR